MHWKEFFFPNAKVWPHLVGYGGRYLHVIKFSQLLNFLFQTLLRNYETDIEQLNKQQKLQVEKAEVAQGLDMKLASKKLKADQVSSELQA